MAVAHEVIMPQMGESITEGTITGWLKKVGDKVARDEPLFEISTDKVDAEIPSPASGVLREIRAEVGQIVPISQVVAIIDNEDEAQVEAPPPRAAAPKAPKAPEAPEAQAAAPARPARSSPVVRKIAAEHGVDLKSLSGTGDGGRITKEDILTHLTAKPAAEANPTSTAVPAAYRARAWEGDRVEELSSMRAKIADHMLWSRRISPHVQTVWEADVHDLVALRAKHKDRFASQHGTSLTFTSFIAKATVDALKEFPALNASLDGTRVIYHRDINLGLAVALDWGLIVPVLKNASELNLLGLQKRIGELAARARQKQLKPDDVQNGSFTITNPGVYGALFGVPIINQPQVAILNVGKIEKRPVVVDDMIAIRSRMYLCLSFDHRVVDGAVADAFMAKLTNNLESFDESELL